MITYVPNTTLVGARVWYAVKDSAEEDGKIYVPSVVIDERGPIITLKCLSKLREHWRPRLDLTDPAHAAMLDWRTGYCIPGDPKVEYHSVHRPNAIKQKPLI